MIFNEYSQRNEEDRREMDPDRGGRGDLVGGRLLDYWGKERREWWGRIRRREGHKVWIKAADLQPVR